MNFLLLAIFVVSEFSASRPVPFFIHKKHTMTHTPHYTNLTSSSSPRTIISHLMQLYYTTGWVSGTGGGISIRDDKTIYIAPSGVHKERVKEHDIFEMNLDGEVLKAPENSNLKISACQPLFFHAFRERDAGAVIHSHALSTLLATLTCITKNEENKCHEFRISQIEMIKGIKGHGFYDTLVVPVIENTAHEHELADEMLRVMRLYPRAYAILVKRHGVYIWGDTWEQCKTHAECYHYLFEAAVEMKKLGVELIAEEKKE